MDRLAPLVYDDLRRLARRHMHRERDDHVLQSTALVNEAFMHLGEGKGMHWQSRSHFLNWMSTLMRRILVDHARRRDAAKRGAGVVVHSLEALRDECDGEELHADPAGEQWLSLLQLNQALQKLAVLDPRQAQVVEMRFFGGFDVAQTAEALQISPATVKREWATARAWLLCQLGP